MFNPIDSVSQAAATASSSSLTLNRRSQTPNPFSLAKQGKMTPEKTAECHRAVAKFIVKDVQPFTTVESIWFRYAL